VIRRIALAVALVVIGYGFGQAFGPPTAAAGSVDQIVRELSQLRRATQDISRKMDRLAD
jgi:hypothetical protein